MITEDQLEQLAIQWFQDTGWNHVHGAVIAPEGVAAEREDFRAVVMKGRLAEAGRISGSRQISRQSVARGGGDYRDMNRDIVSRFGGDSGRKLGIPTEIAPRYFQMLSISVEGAKWENKERRCPIALTMRDPWGRGLPRSKGVPWASADGFRRSLRMMPRWGGRRRMRS
jgi:hypothetical protein